MAESTISVVDSKSLTSLFGSCDQHLRAVRDALDVRISTQGEQIRIEGNDEAVSHARTVIEELTARSGNGRGVSEAELAQLLLNVQSGERTTRAAAIDVFTASLEIRPRTAGQTRYVNAIDENDLVFCLGPAGTGKTYLAVAQAVAALKRESIKKLVLVRPAVEAGESLGFLPGDLQSKINPYLRPLLDALREMMDHEQIKRYMERDLIEVIPLAYMRGRTLNDAFVILDEAQNTTIAQMKMFLTRLGWGSKMVVSGDATQVDLPSHARSGLTDAVRRLKQLDGSATVRLSESDIVRHPLVQRIVTAYDDGGSRRREGGAGRRRGAK